MSNKKTISIFELQFFEEKDCINPQVIKKLNRRDGAFNKSFRWHSIGNVADLNFKNSMNYERNLLPIDLTNSEK